MDVSSPDVVVLTDAQREELTGLVRAGRSAQRLVLRARIVLLAAAGGSNTAVAAAVGSCVDTVRKWRHALGGQPGDGVAGRCETLRPPAAVHPDPGRSGQGAGLYPAG